MDNSIRARRQRLAQRLDDDADVLVAWLVSNPALWLVDGEQLPDELTVPARAPVAAPA